MKLNNLSMKKSIKSINVIVTENDRFSMSDNQLIGIKAGYSGSGITNPHPFGSGNNNQNP